MTTSPPAVSVSTTDVCRITVEGPNGRADLALPVATPLAALLPTLLRHVATSPERANAPWVLQRLGEEPLDLDGSPDSLGLRHGDVLYLRPADEPLPGLQFDDISDGVAHAVGSRSDLWRPELTRGLGLAVAGLVLAALGVTAFQAGPGILATAACAVTAVVLTALSAVLSRAGADRITAGAAGLGGLLSAAVAGFAPFAAAKVPANGLPPGRHGHAALGHFALGSEGLLIAAGAVAVLAGLLLALRVVPFTLPGTALVCAVAAAVGVGVARIGDLSAVRAAGIVAVAMFVLGHFGPRLTLRAARLRVPQLPRTAEELQQGIEPEPEETVTRRVLAASSYLNTLSISSALVYAVAFAVLVHESGWIGWLLPLVFSAAVLLRARGLGGAFQRVPMTLVGAFGLAVVAITRLAPLGTTERAAVLGVLLAAVGLLLVAAWRLPTGRLLPVWGHLGDIAETLTAVALLPLLLQALHVYAFFRQLAS
ncbi:type VII secretion integral membrane protein EccD [Streptomyces fuscigenes]|uniref:type VII secretion integral membrane protein EccD n=1 Tax=Streptomyces fuscigenes TaxID=1528880 RepID=UPI001F3A9BC0|nr:type VII secretion integral membrane protein EccD [Streptomyces fuscigenes]MCF3962430.1 type VII secretion integral membrane protein EccD [Streptomyces fuscigenes]